MRRIQLGISFLALSFFASAQSNRANLSGRDIDPSEAPLKLGLYGDRDAAPETGEQSWKVLEFDKRTGKRLWEILRAKRFLAPSAT